MIIDCNMFVSSLMNSSQIIYQDQKAIDGIQHSKKSKFFTEPAKKVRQMSKSLK